MIMTIVYFENNISEFLCISDPVISDQSGSEMDVEIGECLQFEENNAIGNLITKLKNTSKNKKNKK